MQKQGFVEEMLFFSPLEHLPPQNVRARHCVDLYHETLDNDLLWPQLITSFMIHFSPLTYMENKKDLNKLQQTKKSKPWCLNSVTSHFDLFSEFFF